MCVFFSLGPWTWKQAGAWTAVGSAHRCVRCESASSQWQPWLLVAPSLPGSAIPSMPLSRRSEMRQSLVYCGSPQDHLEGSCSYHNRSSWILPRRGKIQVDFWLNIKYFSEGVILQPYTLLSVSTFMGKITTARQSMKCDKDTSKGTFLGVGRRERVEHDKK